jgi:hypothetical protein
VFLCRRNLIRIFIYPRSVERSRGRFLKKMLGSYFFPGLPDGIYSWYFHTKTWISRALKLLVYFTAIWNIWWSNLIWSGNPAFPLAWFSTYFPSCGLALRGEVGPYGWSYPLQGEDPLFTPSYF